MQPSSTNSKLPIIITIIVIVASLGYYFYSAGDISVDSESALSLASTNTNVGANVLNLLGQINSLKIDTTFFATPVYESLIDFSVPIPSENVGKANPFVSF